jgi:drug/metabolite transporter (DMT)-like permease
MRGAAARPDATGLLLLFATVTGWGLNWPAMKVLLVEIPPFTIRAVTGGIGVALLLPLALLLGQSLRVPRGMRARLGVAALLNVTAWMGLASFSLLWLAAGEATIVCYTMPVWTSLLAWAVLGERPGWRRLLALALALAALAVLVLGQGVQAGLDKLPGVGFALAAAILFSLGTVITKRWPLALPPVSSVTWQIALGILPLVLGALLVDRVDPTGVSGGGWLLLLYGGLGPLALCYLAWFAALRRLPAAAAAAGTLLTPVVGVVSAALALGEPLGLREVLALGLTVAGVVLAVRG